MEPKKLSFIKHFSRILRIFLAVGIVVNSTSKQKVSLGKPFKDPNDCTICIYDLIFKSQSLKKQLVTLHIDPYEHQFLSPINESTSPLYQNSKKLELCLAKLHHTSNSTDVTTSKVGEMLIKTAFFTEKHVHIHIYILKGTF